MKLKPPAFSLKKSVQGVLHFSQSGNLLAQVTSRLVVWSVPNREVICTVKAVPNEHFVAFHEATGCVAIKNTNGELAFIDIASGQTISATGKFKTHRIGCQPWFSDDGNYLLDGGAGGKLTLWSVASAKPEKQWDIGSAAIADIAHSATRRTFACLHDPANTCRLAFLGDDFESSVPVQLRSSDFGVDDALWWEAGNLVFSPCGTKLALTAKTQARENRSRLFVLDLERTSLGYSVEVGDDSGGSPSSLSWSNNDLLALVYRGNPWHRGMGVREYEANCKSRIWESVYIFQASSGRQLQHDYLPSVNRVAFRPGDTGLAINCTQLAGAYLPNTESLSAFARSRA